MSFLFGSTSCCAGRSAGPFFLLERLRQTTPEQHKQQPPRPVTAEKEQKYQPPYPRRQRGVFAQPATHAAYPRRDTSSGDEAPDGFGGGRQRLRSKPATYPVGTLNDPRYFLPATCFAAAACFFFSAAALALTCFCATCLCTNFGDLSPIFTLPFFDGLIPGCV
jgi:hypothetical protein